MEDPVRTDCGIEPEAGRSGRLGGERVGHDFEVEQSCRRKPPAVDRLELGKRLLRLGELAVAFGDGARRKPALEPGIGALVEPELAGELRRTLDTALEDSFEQRIERGVARPGGRAGLRDEAGGQQSAGGGEAARSDEMTTVQFHSPCRIKPFALRADRPQAGDLAIPAGMDRAKCPARGLAAAPAAESATQAPIGGAQGRKNRRSGPCGRCARFAPGPGTAKRRLSSYWNFLAPDFEKSPESFGRGGRRFDGSPRRRRRVRARQ